MRKAVDAEGDTGGRCPRGEDHSWAGNVDFLPWWRELTKGFKRGMAR